MPLCGQIGQQRAGSGRITAAENQKIYPPSHRRRAGIDNLTSWSSEG
jgi:hypothetical protein